MGNFFRKTKQDDCQAYQFRTNQRYTEEKFQRVRELTAGMTPVGEFLQSHGKPLLHHTCREEFVFTSPREEAIAKEMGHAITQRLQYSDEVALATRVMNHMEYIFAVVPIEEQ